MCSECVVCLDRARVLLKQRHAVRGAAELVGGEHPSEPVSTM